MSLTDATIVFQPTAPPEFRTTITQNTANVFTTGVNVATIGAKATLTVGTTTGSDVQVKDLSAGASFTSDGFSGLVSGVSQSATITVTGSDGSTQTYKFNLTRAAAPILPAANANATFKINNTPISDNGSISVTSNAIDITITPVTLPATVPVVSAGATYTVAIGSSTPSSSYTGIQTIALSGLSSGANTITVLVTSSNGTVNRTYTFTVNVPISASALDANNADSQGVVYTLDSPAAGQATVSGKIESFTTTEVVIPSQVSSGGNTYDVVSIVGAFNGASSLLSVNIPPSVTSIGMSAFESCGNLVTVIGAQGVLSLGMSAFNNCSSLASAPIGPSVTYLDQNAFAGCGSLLSVTIPNSVTQINGFAFFSCGGITSLTLGESVANIGHAAFDGCNAVTTVNVAANFTNMGILSSFPNLTTFNLPSNNRYVLLDNVFYEKIDDNNAVPVKSFRSITNVVIPADISIGGVSSIPITSIPNSAFHNCTQLTTVTIPSSVTSIGMSAFESCGNLVTVIGAQGVLSLGMSAFNNCSSLASAPIGPSVTSIPSTAFAGCGSLLSVIIPDSVTAIDMMAFYSCGGITSLTLGASVATIGWAAFDGCNAVTTVNVAANFTQFAILSFFPNLSIFNLPSNNTYIIQDKVVYQKIGDNNAVPVKSFRNITNAVIPATISIGGVSLSITSIPGMADGNSGPFQDMTSLTSVTIGANVTSIGYMGFFGCSQLSSAIFLCDYDTTLHASGNANGYINLFYNARFQNIAAGALLYYAESAAGWSEITENPSPLEHAYSNYPFVGLPIMLTTYDEGMDFASGTMNVPDNGSLNALTGGTVAVSSGSATVDSTAGGFTMNLNNGSAVVITFNGSSSASVSLGSGQTLNTSEGTFAGILSGAGTLGKTGLGMLTLSGDNSSFSGVMQVYEGTLKATSAAALGTGTLKIGSSLTNYDAKFVMDSSTSQTVSIPIEALTNGFVNIVANEGSGLLTIAGGAVKNGTKIQFNGEIEVDSNITGSDPDSDIILGDSSTIANVTLVSGNTYDYNGPTTVNSGSTLTLQDGVSLTNSDVTINAGATLVLEYTGTNLSCNTVKSLTLNGSLIINISSDLTAGFNNVLTAISSYPTIASGASITINHTGSNSSSVTVTSEVNGYNMQIIVDDNTTPTPTSNVCFPAKTPVLTNCGYVNIEEIDPAVHTIRNKKIVAITKTVAYDKNLVRIAKHALGHLYPEKTTFISQNHKVFCQGQMVKAKHLVDDCNITLVPYNGQVLYNVLLAEHEKMQVNNLIVETLHPEHKVAKLYRILKNVDAAHHGKMIALFNKCDREQRLRR